MKAKRSGFRARAAAALGGLVLAALPAGMAGASPAGGVAAAPAVSAAAAALGQTGGADRVLRVISVGTVLTGDGTIWVYRPDRGRWMTIDAAYAEEGRTTHVLPLPVAPEEIADMDTWGFFLSTTGELWLYDIEKNRWEKLPPPGSD